MVVPAQVTPVQIHGGEVENDLKKPREQDKSSGQRWQTAQIIKEVIQYREVYHEVAFPYVHTFSPGVTDILQMQCM